MKDTSSVWGCLSFFAVAALAVGGSVPDAPPPVHIGIRNFCKTVSASMAGMLFVWMTEMLLVLYVRRGIGDAAPYR